MISWFEVTVFSAKTAIVLLYVVGLYRLLGKRNAGLLNVYDLATVAMVANALQNGMTEGRGELVIGLVSSFTLILLGWLLSKVFVRSPGMQRVLSGIPSLLVYQGEFYEDRMRREHISHSELIEAIRNHGISDIKEVGMAVLERDGSISVVPSTQGATFPTDLI